MSKNLLRAVVPEPHEALSHLHCGSIVNEKIDLSYKATVKWKLSNNILKSKSQTLFNPSQRTEESEVRIKAFWFLKVMYKKKEY